MLKVGISIKGHRETFGEGPLERDLWRETFGGRPLERDLWRETFGERPLERHTSGLGHTFAGFFPGCIAWFLLSVLCEEVRNGPFLHSIL